MCPLGYMLEPAVFLGLCKRCTRLGFLPAARALYLRRFCLLFPGKRRALARGGLLALARVAPVDQAQQPPPPSRVPGPLAYRISVSARVFNYPYRGARDGGKVAQPRRPPVDPSGMDETIPGWRPLTANAADPPLWLNPPPRGVPGVSWRFPRSNS